MNLLIIEDEDMIREGICEFLTEQGYHVIGAANGEKGLKVLEKYDIHLMVLDIMLPKMDGIQVLKEVRKTSNIPILMLTAMADETTQIRSFDALADDYMSKPFSLIVLKKRIEALLRRNYKKESIWRYGGALVDFNGYFATYEGVDIQIKPKEVKLLSLLLEHTGQVLTRNQILDHIWGKDEAPYDRVVDVYIKNLRKKLHLDCITTVKGIGYKLEV